MSHDCGSCQYFLKLKNDRFSGGLCDYLDRRTDTDRGRGCKFWKGIPYDRKKSRDIEAALRALQ